MGPLKPMWFKANGKNLVVAEAKMGSHDLMSFPNLVVCTGLRTYSELVYEKDKHNFVNPEAMATPMVEPNF